MQHTGGYNILTQHAYRVRSRVYPVPCPSVPAWTYSRKPAAAGLLLWARRTGDMDRCIAILLIPSKIGWINTGPIKNLFLILTQN